MLHIIQIADKVESLKTRYAKRDQRFREITAVRNGDIESVYPDMFSDSIGKPMIANFVDVVARDLAEVLAPLPSINCSTTSSKSEKAKEFADMRSRIANHYVQHSGLQTQMYSGADWAFTYAYMPIVVEPDFETKMPRIRVENPLGVYPEFDRYGRCVSYTKRYYKTVGELVAEYPQYQGAIIGNADNVNYNSDLELVYYQDAEQIVLFLPKRGNLILNRAKNPLGKVSIVVPKRPGVNPDDPRGQFDDVLWVQIARARFSLLAMEAAEKSVQAPIVVPQDIDEFAFGPDAILRTNNPQGVRRVGLELPTGAFTEQQILEQEMRMGSRYPEGRSGTMDASVITGSGVQALLGSFDSQIKAMQTILAEAFEQVISLCFEMDEKVFPETKKSKGTFNGAPYEFEYNPVKDIKGDYTVQVRYGLMAGLDPSRALIFSLQALQANLVSHDFIMRELPWSMNIANEQQQIDVERMRDSLSGALAALSGAIPQMAMQGQDPSAIVEKIAKTITLRQKGKSIEDAVSAVFEPPAPPPAPEPTAPTAPQPSVEQMVAQGMGPESQQPTQEQQPPAPAETAGQPAPAGQPPIDLASILSQMGG